MTLPATTGIDDTKDAARGAGSRRVWILTTHRAGDRAQMLALAQALGWPFEEKRLAHNRWVWVPGILQGASRLSLDRRASDGFAPPWPDLVIASGRRSVPIARWIRNRSGGHARLLHVGRPWAPLRLFDLVVTTPQYGLPVASNVLHNTLTLNRIHPEQLMKAATSWRDRLADLPRPYVALIVGGAARPYYLDPETARRLGREASALATRTNSSLLVTTSKRTPPESVEALFQAISAPAARYRWSERPENPYAAFLALAETLIVTGDSASMLSEACATGKPVFLFALPERLDLRLALARRLHAATKVDAAERMAASARSGRLARLYDRLVDLGLITSTRDMTRFHERLVEQGLATRLGQSLPSTRQQPPDVLERTAVRVRALFP